MEAARLARVPCRHFTSYPRGFVSSYLLVGSSRLYTLWSVNSYRVIRFTCESLSKPDMLCDVGVNCVQVLMGVKLSGKELKTTL